MKGDPVVVTLIEGRPITTFLDGRPSSTHWREIETDKANYRKGYAELSNMERHQLALKRPDEFDRLYLEHLNQSGQAERARAYKPLRQRLPSAVPKATPASKPFAELSNVERHQLAVENPQEFQRQYRAYRAAQGLKT